MVLLWQIFIYKLGGIVGAISAASGTVLPTTVLIPSRAFLILNSPGSTRR